MAVRVLAGRLGGDIEGACLYDSGTGWAFGPIFKSEFEADAFLSWLEKQDGRDSRVIPDPQLERLYHTFNSEYRCPECDEPREDEPTRFRQVTPGYHYGCARPEEHTWKPEPLEKETSSHD